VLLRYLAFTSSTKYPIQRNLYLKVISKDTSRKIVLLTSRGLAAARIYCVRDRKKNGIQLVIE